MVPPVRWAQFCLLGYALNDKLNCAKIAPLWWRLFECAGGLILHIFYGENQWQMRHRSRIEPIFSILETN